MVVAAWSCHRLSLGASLFRPRSAAQSCFQLRTLCRKGMSRARNGEPRHAGHASSSALQLQPSAEPQPTLEWLASEHGAAERLKLRRSYLGEQLGWGIIATEDVEPGEVLLSVPLDAAITSEGADESKWSVHMANELLRHKSLGAASPLHPWLDALPDHVPLPWLYYTDEELEAIQDPHALEECHQLSAVFADACEGSPHSAEEVAWALSIIHSRSFLFNGIHVFVPGIDFCNHSASSPTATVRCEHPLSQGAEAEAEVCEPQPLEPSRFELVAGEGGIRAGQEVTISYGSWPNDVFLLFFGFVPSEGELEGSEGQGGGSSSSSDSVILFSGLQELALCYHQLVQQQQQQEEDEQVQERVLQLWKQALTSGALRLGEDYGRLVVTGTGFDARLLQATATLIQLYPTFFGGSSSSNGSSGGGSSGQGGSGSGSPLLDLPSFIRLRCLELLEEFPTSCEQDLAWLAQQEQAQAQAQGEAGSEDGSGSSGNMLTAVRFRLGKKAVLQAAVQHLEGA